jgi:hypothetical protein
MKLTATSWEILAPSVVTSNSTNSVLRARGASTFAYKNPVLTLLSRKRKYTSRRGAVNATEISAEETGRSVESCIVSKAERWTRTSTGSVLVLCKSSHLSHSEICQSTGHTLVWFSTHCPESIATSWTIANLPPLIQVATRVIWRAERYNFRLSPNIFIVDKRRQGNIVSWYLSYATRLTAELVNSSRWFRKLNGRFDKSRKISHWQFVVRWLWNWEQKYFASDCGNQTLADMTISSSHLSFGRIHFIRVIYIHYVPPSARLSLPRSV